MKKTLLFFTFLLTLHFLQGQSLVFGLRSIGGPTGYSHFAVIDPLSGTVLELEDLEEVQAIVLGSSTMDQQQGKYIFTGIDQENQGKTFFHDAYTGVTESELLEIPVLNGLQFDLLSGAYFGLSNEVIDSTLGPGGLFYEYTYESLFVEVDLQTGTEVYSQSIPEADAMVLGTSTVDPINGFYYFIGIRPNNSTALFGIDLETGEVVHDVSMGLSSGEYLNELEYDMTTGKFYALHRVQQEMYFSEISLVTGLITDLLDLTDDVAAFTPDASVFHQETGRFIMLTVNGQNNGILTIDANTATILAHPSVAYSLIELEVDNVAFASALVAGIEEQETMEFQLFPNPSQDHIQLIVANEMSPQTYVVYDLQGKQVAQGRYSEGKSINLSGLVNGPYSISLQDGTNISTRSFQIQR